MILISFTLYKIFYYNGSTIVYLGRTKQKLQDRLRGHFFGKPMHRKIDINLVFKIEYAEFKTEADMFLYEIYYINLYKPSLNRDDKACDNLTVKIQEVTWNDYECPLMDKWKEEINSKITVEERARQAKRAFEEEKQRRRREMNHDDYLEWLEKTMSERTVCI